MLHGTGLFIADCGGPAPEQVDIHDRSCGLWTAHAGAEEKCEEERAEERNRYILTITPILHPPCAACGRGGEGRGVWTEGVKLSLRKGTGKMLV